VPITELEVKALISRPTKDQVLMADKSVTVSGAAWTGESEVVKVELSTDGGRKWAGAKLLGKAVPNAWRLWQYEWRTPRQAGRYALMARATDRRGRGQPLERDLDRRNYMINHVMPIEVEVR
jgi:hypothetical protein